MGGWVGGWERKGNVYALERIVFFFFFLFLLIGWVVCCLPVYEC